MTGVQTCALPIYTAPLIKTSRLKMKSFSTVRDTQRGSQSYMEKRRGRRVKGRSFMICAVVAYLYHIGNVPVERDHLIQDEDSSHRNNVLKTGRRKMYK